MLSVMEGRVKAAVDRLGETTTLGVIAELGITDPQENELARVAVWRLLEQGAIHLTRERKLRV